MRSWPNTFHHVFPRAARGKDKLSRPRCSAGELGLIYAAPSRAAVAGSLLGWQPCPVSCNLVEK